MSDIETRKQELIERLKNHDYATFKHSERVEELVHNFGVYLGYQGEDLRILHQSARFHDIGKLNIDQDILRNNDKLTEDEFREIKKHTIYSEEILKELNPSIRILQAVRSHHENYDGTGYPDKLDYNSISPEAEIIRIIDSYDAIVNNRPYSAAEEKEKALCEILSLKGKFYNPDLAERFVEYMTEDEMPDI